MFFISGKIQTASKTMTIPENISSIEPMLPPDGHRKLEDLAIDLATKASGLASQLAPSVRLGIGDLVRSVNCYYSNLIEGHDTHPRDIDRALIHADYCAWSMGLWRFALFGAWSGIHYFSLDVDSGSSLE